MIVFVDNINFKNENNFKSLFTYIKLNNIKYIKNTYGDKGLKTAQGYYKNYIKQLPPSIYSKEYIFDNYWGFFKDELLLHLLKKEELYSSSLPSEDKILFDYLYLNYYEELEYNLRATLFWLNYWKQYINFSNIYVCFANALIYTKTLSSILEENQIPMYVVEHFATGNDFYFDRRYTHIPNNISAPEIEFSIKKYSNALIRLETWNNKNVKQKLSPKKSFFNQKSTFLLSTQVVNDFSIICTERKYLSVIKYYKLIIDKVISDTESNLIIKTHPYEKVKNKRSITFDILVDYIYKFHGKDIHRIKIVEDYNLEVLIDNIQCAILFNSQIAFEIAQKGKPIITLGNPFYGGYFTIDKEVDTLKLKNADEYKFNSEKYKHYLVNIMEYLYNNDDLEKIKKELSQYSIEINSLTENNSTYNRNNIIVKNSNMKINSVENSNMKINSVENFLIKKFASDKKYNKYKNKRDLFYHDTKNISGKIMKLLFYRK